MLAFQPTQTFNEPVLIDLYTIVDGEVVRLTSDDLSIIGERMILTPMQDGSFIYRGSGGAMTGGYAKYAFSSNGSSLEKTASVTYDFSVAEEFLDEDTGQAYTTEKFEELYNYDMALDLNDLKWTNVLDQQTSTVDQESTDSSDASVLENLAVGQSVPFPEELVGTWHATYEISSSMNPVMIVIEPIWWND